jgi:hypothetical protein
VVALRVFFFLSLVLLTACSRQSDVSSPSVFDPSVLPNCEIDLGQQELLTALSIISNHKNEADRQLAAFTLPVPIRLTQNYSFLIENLSFLVTLLAGDRSYDIENVEGFASFFLASVTAELTINGQIISLEEGVESERVSLGAGLNTISIDIEADATVIETREACTVKNVGDDDENPNEKRVKLRQTVNVDITKNDLPPNQIGFLLPQTSSYGASIASWGDLVFVGAPNSENSEGRVDVFTRDNSGWRFQQTIKASNAGAGDEFGSSIAVYDNQLVITAPGEDGDLSGIFNGLAVDSGFSGNVNDNSGAVYVYTSEGSNWTETAYIKKPLNTIGANGYEHGFGSDIAIYADRLIVGAFKDSSYFDSIEFVETGRAYLYQFNGVLGWELEVSLESSFRRSGDLFGASVDIHKNRAIVGAPGDSSRFQGVVSLPDEVAQIDDSNADYDATEASSGAVYLFENTGTSWVKNAYLKAENAEAGDRFGEAVSLADNKLLVGAPFEDGSGVGLNQDMFTNGLAESGAAYYFQAIALEDSAQETWNLQTYFKSTDPKLGANFGAELDIDNNWYAIAEPKSAISGGQGLGLGQVSLYNNNLERVLNGTFPDDNTQTAQELFGASLALGKDSLFIGAPGFVVDDENGGFIVGAGAFSVYE